MAWNPLKILHGFSWGEVLRAAFVQNADSTTSQQVALVGSSATYDNQATVNAVAAALPAQAGSRFILTADPANAAGSYIYVGSSASQHTPLSPGQSMTVQPVNLNLVYARASVDGLLLDIYGEA